MGTFVHVIMNVNLTVNNTIFENGYSTIGGAIYLSGDSQININHTQLLNNFAKTSGGAIYALSFRKIVINETKFYDNYADLNGGDLYAVDSIEAIEINKTLIQDYESPNSIYMTDANLYSNSLKIERSYKTYSFTDQGGSIYCYDCGYFFVQNLTVVNSSAESGGAIYMEQSEQKKQKLYGSTQAFYRIINSLFTNNRATKGDGGAIYFDNLYSTLIENTTFNRNQANKNGGGFLIGCPDPYNCSFTLSQTNTFKNNMATSSGGAFYWNDIQPKLTSSAKYEFNNNKAKVYADNIGSFPQKIVYITEEQYQAQRLRANPDAIIISDRLRMLQSSAASADESALKSNSTSVEQQDARSGGQLPVMYLALADTYGQIVGTESSKKLEVGFKSTTSNGSTALLYQPSVAGINTFYSEYGVYKLTNITFTGAPGQSYELALVSEGIDMNKPANKEYVKSSTSNSTSTNNGGSSNSGSSTASTVEFKYEITLRDCAIGEKFTDAGACESCPEDKSFSLVKMTEPGVCKTCPTTKAICNGGSNIGPQPGYWRKNNATSVFVKCFYTPACLGMQPPENNPQGSCATGYNGILCADCESGYSVSGSFQCNKCPEFSVNVFRICAILVVAICVIVFMIRSTLKGAADVKNITSVFQKILLNHIQLIVLTASFDFSWPQLVQSFFKSNETVGEASNQIFSVDCFLNNDQGYESASGGSNKATEDGTSFSDAQETPSAIPIRIFYFKLALFSVLPVLLVTVCYVVWSIILRKSTDKSLLLSRATSSVVILLFLVHPNIVKYVFNAFNCVDIDGDQRVKNDLEILCYHGQHTLWALAIALPALVVWGLGIPLFAFILLTRESKKLELLTTRQKYGFLFRGYKQRFYYWEIVIMYRKIFLIFIQVFLVNYGVMTQAMLVLLMLIGFMSINLTKYPFQTVALNELESLSLVTSLLTIFCGVFYIVSVDTTNVNNGDESSSSEVYLNEDTKIFLFFVIVLSNLTFLVYWAYKFYQQLQNMLIKKFAFLYTYLCLCGNKAKYQDTLKNALMEEDNTLLREKYTEALRQLQLLQDNGDLILNDKTLEKVLYYLQKDKVLLAAGIDMTGLTEDEKKLRNKRIKRIIENAYKKNYIVNGTIMDGYGDDKQGETKKHDQTNTIDDFNMTIEQQISHHTRLYSKVNTEDDSQNSQRNMQSKQQLPNSKASSTKNNRSQKGFKRDKSNNALQNKQLEIIVTPQNERMNKVMFSVNQTPTGEAFLNDNNLFNTQSIVQNPFDEKREVQKYVMDQDDFHDNDDNVNIGFTQQDAIDNLNTNNTPRNNISRYEPQQNIQMDSLAKLVARQKFENTSILVLQRNNFMQNQQKIDVFEEIKEENQKYEKLRTYKIKTQNTQHVNINLDLDDFEEEDQQQYSNDKQKPIEFNQDISKIYQNQSILDPNILDSSMMPQNDQKQPQQLQLINQDSLDKHDSVSAVNITQLMNNISSNSLDKNFLDSPIKLDDNKNQTNQNIILTIDQSIINSKTNNNQTQKTEEIKQQDNQNYTRQSNNYNSTHTNGFSNKLDNSDQNVKKHSKQGTPRKSKKWVE